MTDQPTPQDGFVTLMYIEDGIPLQVPAALLADGRLDELVDRLFAGLLRLQPEDGAPAAQSSAEPQEAVAEAADVVTASVVTTSIP